MCGIAGKIGLDPSRPVDETVISRMTEVLAHRGPDGEGIRIDGPVGLGHRRLAIIDLSPTGKQPMSNEDGSIWVVCNGEIYNHVELRERLESRGHRFRGTSDTQVILHLYEEYGPDCVDHLRGMFAFALWDGNERVLLLARDRFGQKPLVYADTNGGFVFASELKAILQDEAVPAEVDEIALHHYLTYGYVPAPRTIFRHIRKLQPAHRLVWRDGRLSVERYWDLAYTPKISIDEEEAAEEILRLLREATRLRLMSDVPLGAFLSGGVDSSAIVALMAEETSGPVKTFSIGFDDESFDETPYARQVARQYQTDHHEFTVTAEVIGVLPELVWAYGDPYADSSALPSYYVAKMTRRQVTVALNGDGGDEAFAGYGRYVANYLSDYYRYVPGWLRNTAIPSLARHLPESTSFASPLRRIKRFVLAQEETPVRRYMSWLSILNNRKKDALYTAEFAERVATSDPITRFEEVFRAADGQETLDRVLFADVRMYLPDDLLVKIDIATMIHSLEARSPFLDHRLAEFVARLPARFKLRGRNRKYILKKALANHLPDKILNRGKYGFGAPVGRWFRGDLHKLAEDVLLATRATRRGIFAGDAVRRMLNEHFRGRINHGYAIWGLLMLELWFRTYMDRPRSDLKGPAEGILPTPVRGGITAPRRGTRQ